MSMSSAQAEASLKPVLDKYVKLLNENKTEEVVQMYHPNSTVVQTDKSCHWGHEAILQSFKDFATHSGKSTSKFLNLKFQGAGDYVMVDFDFDVDTEKLGNLKGSARQIWVKAASEYQCYHDEFHVNV